MKIKQSIMTFIREDDGLTTVEYAIAGSLVGAAVIAAFTDLGDVVCQVIDYIAGAVASNTNITDPSTAQC